MGKGYITSESSVGRYIVKDLKITKNENGLYQIPDKTAYEQRLELLEDTVRKYTHEGAMLEPDVKIATLKTKKYGNRRIAISILKLFTYEIVDVDFPAEDCLIIYYKSTGDSRLLDFFANLGMLEKPVKSPKCNVESKKSHEIYHGMFI